MNGSSIMCIACEREIIGNDCACDATEALRELVELKRMKDADSAPAEYERRKLIAWRDAFRVFGYVGDPKP
jgi:hypothetical protein